MKYVLLAITIATLGMVPSTLYAQDVVLLSYRYNEDAFSDEIVGEVKNNGTRTYDKFEVNIVGSFYDAAGGLVGSEVGYIDAESLNVGSRSAFNVFTVDDAIRNDAVTYDLSINDQRVVQGASAEGGEGSSDNGFSFDSNGGNGNGNGNDNCDGNLTSCLFPPLDPCLENPDLPQCQPVTPPPVEESEPPTEPEPPEESEEPAEPEPENGGDEDDSGDGGEDAGEGSDANE